MPRIHLCFLWHMHQPFYKDLASGEYKLPWTRMHALKDYYGMVRILEEFPRVRQTFNLVPSMAAQVEEYASGEAIDPFLQTALKPAESLTPIYRAFLLRHSFYSDPQRMIYRYPRYGELFDAWLRQKDSGRRVLFGAQDFRDLQMWSQLAWFDEAFQVQDAEVHEWVARGRNFSPADQHRMGEKQREIVGKVLPVYRKLAATGQTEISTTPYYHPILPLLCDSNIASVAHPGVTLPPRFRHPEDARRQLALARESIAGQFGAAPVGLWPSEGSVSDEVLTIAADLGFQWAATDSGVVNRTLGRAVPVDGLYRQYRWRQGGQSLGVIFRDHLLRDLIGFVYSKIDSTTGASEEQRRLALEELMIAEGSDWCWWYGPEHQSTNRKEFDQLYRSHLANVYRFLNLSPPEELSRPILRTAAPEVQAAPSGPITPTIDGRVTSYFEWIGAGTYHVDERSGSMHGKKFLVKEAHFGSDGANFYLRVDFHPGHEQELTAMEAKLTVQPLDGAPASSLSIAFSQGTVSISEAKLAGGAHQVECAFARILEARISLASLAIPEGRGLRFQFSLWQGGLPMDAVPQQGWVEMRTTDPAEMAG